MKKIFLLLVILITAIFLSSPAIYAETINGWEWVDDKDSKITLEGTWSYWPADVANTDLYYKGYTIYSYGPNEENPDVAIPKATLKFNGTKVRVVGPLDATQGVMDVFIDGKLARTADCSGQDPETYVDDTEANGVALIVLFESADLSPGEHTITIAPTAEEGLWSKSCWDAILYKAGGSTPATKAPSQSAPKTTAAPATKAATTAPATQEPEQTTAAPAITESAAPSAVETTATQAQATTPAASTETPDKPADANPAGNGLILWIIIGVLVIAAAAGGFFILRKNKQ